MKRLAIFFTVLAALSVAAELALGFIAVWVDDPQLVENLGGTICIGLFVVFFFAAGAGACFEAVKK